MGQSLSNRKGVGGNLPQRRPSHVLFGTVNEVAPTFLSQGAVPVPGKDTRLLEKSIEHDQASLELRRQPIDPTRINSRLCGEEKKTSRELPTRNLASLISYYTT